MHIKMTVSKFYEIRILYITETMHLKGYSQKTFGMFLGFLTIGYHDTENNNHTCSLKNIYVKVYALYRIMNDIINNFNFKSTTEGGS